jgi:hypothetical protein
VNAEKSLVHLLSLLSHDRPCAGAISGAHRGSAGSVPNWRGRRIVAVISEGDGAAGGKALPVCGPFHANRCRTP